MLYEAIDNYRLILPATTGPAKPTITKGNWSALDVKEIMKYTYEFVASENLELADICSGLRAVGMLAL